MRRIPLLLVMIAATACERTAPAADVSVETVLPADSVVADSIVASNDLATDPVIVAWVERVDSTVFTRWGACPFECCVYRDWLAEAPVIVRTRPDSTAAVATTIPAGARFEADSGFVRITSAQLVVVTDSVPTWRVTGRSGMGEQDTLLPGDTLLVLDYQGEGHFFVTDGSVVYSGEQFWEEPEDWKPDGNARGRAFGSRDSEWWALVRAPDGTRGWIDAYASRLGNVDACGGPM